MLLSKSCEYGIRASLYLAARQEDGYVSIGEISKELGISFHFLTKVFQKLTQAGLMTSYRGPNGGIALARPAQNIRLLDIYLAIDGPALFTECVLGLPGCGNQKPCPMHDQWAEQRARLEAMFTDTTLAAMGKDITTLDLRLKDLAAASE